MCIRIAMRKFSIHPCCQWTHHRLTYSRVTLEGAKVPVAQFERHGPGAQVAASPHTCTFPRRDTQALLTAPVTTSCALLFFFFFAALHNASLHVDPTSMCALKKDSRPSCSEEPSSDYCSLVSQEDGEEKKEKETTSFFLKEMGFTSLTQWACRPTPHTAKLTFRWKLRTNQSASLQKKQ